MNGSPMISAQILSGVCSWTTTNRHPHAFSGQQRYRLTPDSSHTRWPLNQSDLPTQLPKIDLYGQTDSLHWGNRPS